MGRIINISGAAMLVVFGGFSLWSARHSLSLEVQRQKLGLNGAFGLFESEQTREGMAFRWTGRYGGLPVDIKQRHMELSLLASHPDIQSRPVKVSLYLLKGFSRQKNRWAMFCSPGRYGRLLSFLFPGWVRKMSSCLSR